MPPRQRDEEQVDRGKAQGVVKLFGEVVDGGRRKDSSSEHIAIFPKNSVQLRRPPTRTSEKEAKLVKEVSRSQTEDVKG
jgi:hypothetical protein